MPAKKVSRRRISAKTLIKKAGEHEVAEHFGITIRTVREWLKKGIPAARKTEVEQLKKVIEFKKVQKERFLKMVKESLKREFISRLTELTRRKRDGERTQGIEVLIPINAYFDEIAYLRVIKAIKILRLKNYGNWIITLQLSDMSETNPGGYKTIYPKQFNKKAEGFASQNILTSGAWPSKNLALFAIQKKISEYRNIVSYSYCHTVDVVSYRYKTEEESRAIRTIQRKQRTIRAAQRKSKKKGIRRPRHRVKKGRFKN